MPTADDSIPLDPGGGHCSLETVPRRKILRLLKYMADPYQRDYTQLELQEALRELAKARFLKRKR